jgi:hypothetical protein
MIPDKQRKGSVRYAATNPEAVIQSVYLSRKANPTMPSRVWVTVHDSSEHVEGDFDKARSAVSTTPDHSHLAVETGEDGRVG